MSEPGDSRSLSPDVSACSLLTDPGQAATLSQREWNELVPTLREHGLLARAACRLRAQALLGCVPRETLRHFEAASALCDQHALSVHWELERVESCLGGAGIPYMLLKGAAYLKAGMKAGEGRMFSDMDILVRRSDLRAAEWVLAEHGWRPKQLNPYDERYYREWMHQVPPLAHVLRGSAIDLHHAIVPPTSRLAFSTEEVFDLGWPLAGSRHALLPDHRDLVLHSAVHAFFEEDFTSALRDLSDIDSLVRELSEDDGFALALHERSRALGLERPLSLALALAHHFFGTPLEDSLKSRLPKARNSLTLHLLKAALDPGRPLEPRKRRQAARALLYVRGHYLKMPLRLLAPHLTRKLLHREETETEKA